MTAGGIGAWEGGESTEHPLRVAARWVAAGREVALATVVSTWGSAPRPQGSVMVTDSAGRVVGSVSGGCVEAAVLEAAGRTLVTGHAELLRFGVADDHALGIGLACGGEISVWVERAGPDTPLASMARATERGRGQSFTLDLRTGVWRDAASDDEDHADLFVQSLRPPLRIVVIGAVHIAQHLAAMSHACGYEVVVVDPRTTLATGERFPGTQLLQSWPADALEQLDLDRRTAVVVLTHDPKFDDPALKTALASEAFYVGALGSQRTQDRRNERLVARGVPEQDVLRIHGPVGFDLGARTPGGIAVSILAEIVAESRGG